MQVISGLNLPPVLATLLEDLADPARPGHAAALEALDAGNREREGGLLDQLVRHARSDLVDSGLHAVLEDQIREQIGWNRCRTGEPGHTSFHADGLRFTSPGSGFISLAARQMALEALDKGRVPDVAGFFSDPDRCTVGRERIAEDVPAPAPVLVELASRAALVLSNCLEPARGSGGLDIRNSRLFKLGFEWPLRLAHGFSRMLRYAPATAQAATSVAAICSAAALFVGIDWWRVFIWPPGQGLQVPGLLALVVAPW